MEYQEDYLIHYGKKGMKWGVRRHIQMGRDKIKLRKKYRAEYAHKKASGKSTVVGKGLNRMDLNKTNYAEYKANKAFNKKYGKEAKEYRSKNKKLVLGTSVALTGTALAGLAGVTLSSMAKSRKTTVGKMVVNKLMDSAVDATYKISKSAGKAVGDAAVYSKTAREIAKKYVR